MELGYIAKILIYGDLHLSSKNYGAHRDYPKESLHYFRVITQKAKEYEATHLIGTGDLTYGRFNSLEYRESVDRELVEQYKLVKGNRYEIKGNHDEASYGMTEYDYYINKGIIKGATNIKIGKVNISMVNYGEHETTDILDASKEDEINVVIAHDFFKFKDTRLADYGNAIYLDEFEKWFGVDYLICGHVHNHEMFEGLVVKDGKGHRMVVTYVGCLARPAYRAGHMDETGHLVLLTIEENGDMQYDLLDIPLWDLKDSFNMELKESELERKEEKKQRVDLSDIVNELNNHKRSVGNPEDIIQALEGVDDKYKKKAIQLLKSANA